MTDEPKERMTWLGFLNTFSQFAVFCIGGALLIGCMLAAVFYPLLLVWKMVGAK